VVCIDEHFPGLGQEFMPTLDEGSFLLMPTAMPHAGVEEALQMTREMDMRIASIPEVETVVGKIGRAESALDPAPVSMFENTIMYKSEYKTDDRGRRVRYKVENGEFVRDNNGELIPDNRGRYYRQWRDHIKVKTISGTKFCRRPTFRELPPHRNCSRLKRA
jgi:copper/silver efflux system protein